MALCPIPRTVIRVTYYRYSPGVHLFAFESRMLQDGDKIKPLREQDFISGSTSGLSNSWVENPSLLGFGHCSHALFLQMTSLAFLVRKALHATSV